MPQYTLFTSHDDDRPTDNYSKDSGDDAEIIQVFVPDLASGFHLTPVTGRTRIHIWLPLLPKYEISLWLDDIVGARERYADGR